MAEDGGVAEDGCACGECGSADGPAAAADDSPTDGGFELFSGLRGNALPLEALGSRAAKALGSEAVDAEGLGSKAADAEAAGSESIGPALRAEPGGVAFGSASSLVQVQAPATSNAAKLTTTASLPPPRSCTIRPRYRTSVRSRNSTSTRQRLAQSTSRRAALGQRDAALACAAASQSDGLKPPNEPTVASTPPPAELPSKRPSPGPCHAG